MSSKEDKAALAKFLSTVDWEKYLDDDDIRAHASDIQERIETLQSGSKEGDEDVNIANATRIKLVVVGDGAVGKTSLLISYATKKFPTDYVPTVFENYTAQMKYESESILLHLWDTAGQEDYDRLRPLSYPGADVVLLCFSTVTRGSYDAIREKWFPEVNHYVPNIPHILVGTKVDLRDSETADPHTTQYEPISKEEGLAMAKQIQAAKYLEVSAKTRNGLNKVFKTAVELVLEARGELPAPSRETSSESSNNSKHEKTSHQSKPAHVDNRKKSRCIMM